MQGRTLPLGRGGVASPPLADLRPRPPCRHLQSPVDDSRKPLYTHRSAAGSSRGFSVLLCPRTTTMKVRSSLKSLKTRHRDCKVVRRKGVVYVINKTDPRFKAKQG